MGSAWPRLVNAMDCAAAMRAREAEHVVLSLPRQFASQSPLIQVPSGSFLRMLSADGSLETQPVRTKGRFGAGALP
jgi:hypothetical protein